MGLDRQPETPYLMADNSDIVGLLERQRVILLAQVEKDREQVRSAEQHLAKTEGELRSIDAALNAIRNQTTLGLSNEYTQKLTIKQGVVKVLERTPHGLTALEILERLDRELNMSYERTSLSPQLSRLKKAGIIRLDGHTWFLTKQNNGPGD